MVRYHVVDKAYSEIVDEYGDLNQMKLRDHLDRAQLSGFAWGFATGVVLLPFILIIMARYFVP